MKTVDGLEGVMYDGGFHPEGQGNKYLELKKMHFPKSLKKGHFYSQYRLVSWHSLGLREFLSSRAPP